MHLQTIFLVLSTLSTAYPYIILHPSPHAITPSKGISQFGTKRWISPSTLENLEKRHVHLPLSRPHSTSFNRVRRADSTRFDYYSHTQGEEVGEEELVGRQEGSGGVISGGQPVGEDGVRDMVLVAVYESSSDIQTSAGMITEKCITLVEDPSQTFCETLLDGQVLGAGDSGMMATPNTSSPGTAETVNSTSAVGTGINVTATSGNISSVPINTRPASGNSSQIVNATTPSLLRNTSTSTNLASDPITATAITTAGSETPTSSIITAPTTSVSMIATISTPETVTISPTVTPTSSAEDGAISDSETAADSNLTASITTSMDIASTTDSTDAATDTSDVSSTSTDQAAGTPASNSPSNTITSATTPTGTGIQVSTSVPASGTLAAAQDNSSAAASANTIPGQHLQVLPIGLGIFGGLVVLTLAVVGYVTYERRKYRTQFRTRKAAEGGLAEKGARMGTSYGT